jgi:hypothetical protein
MKCSNIGQMERIPNTGVLEVPLPLGSPLPLHPCRCRAEVREHTYRYLLLWGGDCWNNRLSSNILDYLREILLEKSEVNSSSTGNSLEWQDPTD